MLKRNKKREQKKRMFESVACINKSNKLIEEPIRTVRCLKDGSFLVWPESKNGWHVHYYKDSKTGELKAHLKDEITDTTQIFNKSPKELNHELTQKAAEKLKKREESI